MLENMIEEYVKNTVEKTPITKTLYSLLKFELKYNKF